MKKHVFKWWWADKSEKIELYLERMEKKGWHLTKVSFGMLLFTFQKTDKIEKIRYAIDYQRKIETEYLTIIQDDGWQLFNQCSGWLLWKKTILIKDQNYFLTHSH